MQKHSAWLAALLMLLLCLEPVQAQSPLDAVATALTHRFGVCGGKTTNDCIVVETKNGQVIGSLSRKDIDRQEQTDIKVNSYPGRPDQAKSAFDIDAKSYSTPPTNNVPPIQFWRTETFAVANQINAGVLSAWLAPNPDSVNASGFGAFYCGSLKVDLVMSLYGPPGHPRDDVIVNTMQTGLKDLMQLLGADFVAAGACQNGASSIEQKLQFDHLCWNCVDTGVGRLIYGQSASVTFAVGTSNIKPGGEALAPVGPVSVKLFYDGLQVAGGNTNAGTIYNRLAFSLGPDTPKGRSKHQLKLQASKQGYQPTEASTEIEVWRDLQAIKLSLEPLEGEYESGQRVTIRGTVFADGTGAWGTTPVQAKLSFQLETPKGMEVLAGATTGPDGSFAVDINVPKKTMFDAVLIYVSAEPTDANQYGNVSDNLAIKVQSLKRLLVTMAATTSIYRWDETIALRGTLSAEGNPAVFLRFAFDGIPLGDRTVAANGNFDFSFVPPNPPGQLRVAGAQHSVVVIATAVGYDDGGATAYIIVGGETLPCVPLPFKVATIQGQPAAGTLIPQAVDPNAQPQKLVVPAAEPVAAGTDLAQAMSVRTGAKDRVGLNLPIGNGAEVRIAVDNNTELKIGAFCRDASGRVKMVLSVQNPGKFAIDISNAAGVPFDYEIVTPRTEVNSNGTRYAVAVDERGATTVASLECVALVSDLNGANVAQVQAGQQLVVPLGTSPKQAQLTARSLAIDPALEAMLGGSASGSACGALQPNTVVTNMTIQAARRSVAAGDLILVPVWLIKAAGVANLNLHLSYDAGVLRPEGPVVKGNLLDNALFTPNASQPGTLLAAFAQTGGLAGTGTILSIPFRAIGKPGDRTSLAVGVSTINAPGGALLNIERIDGEVLIYNKDGTFPSPPPPDDGGSPVPSGGGSPALPQPPNMQQGDCDGDRSLTELDALCALEISTQLRPSAPLMDVDNSGDVTSRDAVLILQRALGK